MRMSRFREQAPLALALALAVLVALAVVSRFASPAQTVTSSPGANAATPTATVRLPGGNTVLNPGQPRVDGWKPLITLPPGFVLSGASLAVAPSDGRIAYLCVVALDAQQQPRQAATFGNEVWVTHDGGGSWIFAGIPPIPPVNQCFIRVDRADPNIVALWGRAIPLHGGSGPDLAAATGGGSDELAVAAGNGSGAAVSFNGGATWVQPTDDNTLASTDELITVNGVTYAVQNGALALSSDRMRTWRSLTDQLSAAGQYVLDFWLHPDDGVVIAETADNEQAHNLWLSRDRGRNWTLLSAPDFDAVVAQQPQAGRPWMLCGAAYHPGYEQAPDATPPDHVACSTDEGRTWVTRPLPDLPAPAPAPTATPSTAGAGAFLDVHLVGITGSGALLLADDRAGPTFLYSLPAGADASNAWQTLGTVPGGTTNVTFGPGPNPGEVVLWALPQPVDPYTELDPGHAILVKSLTL